MIPFLITMILLLIGVYFLTIFLHFMGASVFPKDSCINLFLAILPFFYWFKSPKKKEEIKSPIKKEKKPQRKKVVKGKEKNTSNK